MCHLKLRKGRTYLRHVLDVSVTFLGLLATPPYPFEGLTALPTPPTPSSRILQAMRVQQPSALFRWSNDHHAVTSESSGVEDKEVGLKRAPVVVVVVTKTSLIELVDQ